MEVKQALVLHYTEATYKQMRHRPKEGEEMTLEADAVIQESTEPLAGEMKKRQIYKIFSK